jgi:hypothetical protein
MTVWRRAAACVLVVALASIGSAARSGAQSVRLAISALNADSTSPAPSMSITGFETQPELGPYSLSLELSLESQFRAPFYARTVTSETATFTIDSLLPQHAVVYFRVRLSDRFGNVVAEARDQHPVRSWLRLVSIGQPATTTPQFNWSSPAVTVPPGLWAYDLTVINSATGRPEFVAQDLQDTSYVFPQALESSTSYRWLVHARAQNGTPADSVTVMSDSTFVILTAGEPTVTLFYPNFPNPFGRGTRSESTCFWFDLAHQSNVTLTIYDIALREVRQIIPGTFGTGNKLAIGTYGRDAAQRCDATLTWDGHDDAGRTVPLGVYLAIFKGDGVRTSVKLLYKGP